MPDLVETNVELRVRGPKRTGDDGSLSLVDTKVVSELHSYLVVLLVPPQYLEFHPIELQKGELCDCRLMEGGVERAQWNLLFDELIEFGASVRDIWGRDEHSTMRWLMPSAPSLPLTKRSAFEVCYDGKKMD